MERLNQMVNFARENGFASFVVGSKVVVVDSDGILKTDNIKELKEWMGY